MLASSGDSTGLTAAQSKQRYTDVANARPSTLLALNHDVHGTRIIIPVADLVLTFTNFVGSHYCVSRTDP